MDDLQYRAVLRSAATEMKWGKWRTLGLVAVSAGLGLQMLITGSSEVWSVFVLTLIISWQSWRLFLSGRNMFELVSYFGKKLGEKVD